MNLIDARHSLTKSHFFMIFLIPKFPKATLSKAGLEKNCLNSIQASYKYKIPEIPHKTYHKCCKCQT